MSDKPTDSLAIVELASELVHILVKMTEVVGGNLVAFESDNAIKARTDALKARAAAMESELAALRQELAKAKDKDKKTRSELEPEPGDSRAKKEQPISDLQSARPKTKGAKVKQDVAATQSKRAPRHSKSKKPATKHVDTTAQLSLRESIVETDSQAGPAERGDKRVASAPVENTAVTSIQTNHKGDVPAEQQQPQSLPLDAHTPGVADIPQRDIDAATFPNATDRVVFTRAFSDMAGEDEALRIAATKALACIRHELSVRALAGRLQHESSAQVRQHCVKALAALNMKEGLTAVKSALGDQVPAVRLAAVWVLYHLAGQQGISNLTRMLSDENKQVRRRAATCIGWLASGQAAVDTAGDPRSQRLVSALVRGLKDTDKSVRIAVLAALEAVTAMKMSEQPSADENSHQDIIAQWEKWWKQKLLA